ncbi:MAG: protein-disulfide reductase DsbD [bacterium]|nr:protein-disulfide reductase DsbD [bacterium]
MKKMSNPLRFKSLLPLVAAFIFFFSFPAFGQFGQDPFGGSKKPDIETEIKYGEGLILFKLDMDQDHHITDLSYGFFKIQVEKNDVLEISNVIFPKGVSYADETVFKSPIVVKAYVKQLKEITTPVTLKFTVGFQVCQERPREVCFPPDSTVMEVSVGQAFKEARAEDENADTGLGKRDDESWSAWVERIIKQELKEKSFTLFLLVFFAGFLTSFTPCVYPVIPIVMGYVGTRSQGRKLKGLYLSIFFVLGLAIVYSIFGVIAATTGTMMGVSFQNPLVVIIIAGIFIVMGLSLAGFFEIPVPSSISSRMQSGGGKSEVIGALVVGGISGVIAAPCVGPVLIALISWISQTGDVMLGFWLTFTFSMGLGILFLIVGTFSGIVSSMPKGGKWMDYIKYFFALMLLGGGLYLLGSITSDWLYLVMWGIFLVAASVFMGLFKPLEEDDDRKGKTFKVFLVLLFLVGAVLFVRGIDMNYFPAKYAAGEAAGKPKLPWITKLEEGKKIAKAQNQMMMIDTYADWCIACKELDKHTFSDDAVRERLKNVTLVKLDFTKENETNSALLKSLNIIGMPTIIFYKPDGTEIKRFFGFKNAEDFLKFVDSLN